MAARSRQHFDGESGQVYTERTCKAGPSVPDWTWKTRGSINGLTIYRSVGPGCSSLRAMSMRIILANSFNLSTDHLKAMPLPLATQIWNMAEFYEVDSLRLWQTFATIFDRANGGEMHYRRLVLPDHLTRLSDCIKPITSPSFEWITFLTLAHVSCTRTELIQVSRVANLGMLTIGPLLGEETELDNSLVRAWSRAASEAGAFGKLRILVFNDVSYPAITSSVFTYFREFPALAMFLFPLELRSIEFDEDSIANGWFRFRGRKLRSSRLEAQSSVWQDVYRDCFNGDGSVDVCKLETQCNLAHNTTSILDLVCGKSSNNQYSKPTIWNCYGQQTLQTYFRKNGWRDRILRIRKDDDKRAGLTSSDTNRSPPKKRAMRSVKHQHMGALLADFNM